MEDAQAYVILISGRRALMVGFRFKSWGSWSLAANIRLSDSALVTRIELDRGRGESKMGDMGSRADTDTRRTQRQKVQKRGHRL